MTRIALPTLAAAVVTSSVVGVAIGAGDQERDTVSSRSTASDSLDGPVVTGLAAERLGDRRQPVSRAARRVTLKEKPEPFSRAARRVTLQEKPTPVGHRFATVALNVRAGPGANHNPVTVLDRAEKLPVTGRSRGEWDEVIHAGRAFWVAGDYLARNKPEPEQPEQSADQPEQTEPIEQSVEQASEQEPVTEPETEPESAVAPGGVSTAPCASGSSIESGITSAAVTVYRTVCARFPTIGSYGGWRGDGEHSSGRAIDVMVSGDLGWQVAEFLRANSSSLGLYDIIYSQRIWTQDRSSEGWRYISDRGSTTANHYDHVHVQVY